MCHLRRAAQLLPALILSVVNLTRRSAQVGGSAGRAHFAGFRRAGSSIRRVLSPARTVISVALSVLLTFEIPLLQYAAEAAQQAPTGNSSPASSILGVSGTAAPSAETANRVIAVSEFYKSIDQLAAAIPPESISTGALAAALNRDPAKIIEFVKNNIRYEHYDGVLRGAFGTLIGRAGNSWDQCLLIQELLKQSNISSQLIVGRVTDDLDSRLIQRALADRLVIKTLPPPLAGLMPTVDSQYDFLMSAVPGLAAAFKRAPNQPRIVKTYCWLKATINGRAQEIDPILGTPPVVSDTRSLSQVTDQDRYRIDLQIVLKKRSQGRIAQTTLLDFAFATDSLRAKPVLLALQPADPNFVQKVAATTDPFQVLNGIESFVPIVTLNDQTRSGTAFDLSGDTVAAGAGPLQGMSSLGNGLGGMLGGGRIGSLGASRAQPTPRENNFAGVDLTYSIIPPNGSSAHFSRSLVDASAIQPDASKWKNVLAILQDRQILISTFAISPEYVAHLLVEFYRQQRDAMEAMAQGTQASFPLDKISPSPFQLIALSQAQDLAAAALSNQQNILLRGEPGVLVFKNTYTVSDEQIIHRQGIDIVNTGFDSMTPDPTSKVLRARMGIFSSVLETLALGIHDPQSVFSLAKLAQQQSIPTLALTSPEDPALAKMSVSDAQRDAMVEQLKAGVDIVTFARPLAVGSGPRLGWWRIDPETGDMLAILENREGSAEEQSVLTSLVTPAVIGGAVAGLECEVASYKKEGHSGDCTATVFCGAMAGLFVALTFETLIGAGAAWVPGSFAKFLEHAAPGIAGTLCEGVSTSDMTKNLFY